MLIDFDFVGFERNSILYYRRHLANASPFPPWGSFEYSSNACYWTRPPSSAQTSNYGIKFQVNSALNFKNTDTAIWIIFGRNIGTCFCSRHYWFNRLSQGLTGIGSLTFSFVMFLMFWRLNITQWKYCWAFRHSFWVDLQLNQVCLFVWAQFALSSSTDFPWKRWNFKEKSCAW